MKIADIRLYSDRSLARSTPPRKRLPLGTLRSDRCGSGDGRRLHWSWRDGRWRRICRGRNTLAETYLVGHYPVRLEEMRFRIANPTASLYNNRTQLLAALEFACLDIMGQA